MTSRVYSSGADYDAQYADLYEPEIRYLTRRALEQGGAVLDLCCGTGIVTVPLADTGLDVVGVDISAAMLATAKAKTEGSNPAFVLGDVLRVRNNAAFRPRPDDWQRLPVLFDRAGRRGAAR